MTPQPSIRLLGLIALIPLLAVCAGDSRKTNSPSGRQTALKKPMLLKIGPDEDRIGAVAFSPNGQVLAVAGDSTIRLWSLPTGKRMDCTLIPSEDDLNEICRFLAFSPDGKRLVTVHQTRRLDIERRGSVFGT